MFSTVSKSDFTIQVVASLFAGFVSNPVIESVPRIINNMKTESFIVHV